MGALGVGVGVGRTSTGAVLTAASLAGVLLGVGFFTFGYADGVAYLRDDPKGCANCHAMQEHYDSWQNSSHHIAATCNDCHTPHNFVGKWLSKADNGFFHSLAFTTGNYPWPLQIKQRNANITQASCRHCHEATVHNMLPVADGKKMQACVHCHAQVGHAFRARRGEAINR